MKKGCVCIVAMFVMFIASALTHTSKTSNAVVHTLNYFKTESIAFASSTNELKDAISLIDTSFKSIINARQALINCRLHYKRIEFFLEYFFNSTALAYNAPAKYEVEEPYMEFDEPKGLQYIEAMLYNKDVKKDKDELIQNAELLKSSANQLPSLLYNFKCTDEQILESINIELIRVITLSIAGYDAQFLKTGIKEAYEELVALEYCLKPFLNSSEESKRVRFYLNKSIKHLKEREDFDSFDRLDFLTGYALPLQKHLNILIKDRKLNINTTGTINYNATNIFSAGAIKINRVSSAVFSAGMAALGKTLFFEKALSGNNKRSCASCHQPEKYFTDNKVKSVAFDTNMSIERNTPTLLYAGFQYAQFWDGSVKTLEEQVKKVIASPIEMNAGFGVVIKRLQSNKEYVSEFKKAFPLKNNGVISIENIATSIASYIRTLSPMNSSFDKYMQGNKAALTMQQISGFNLFMGKAQCGTCHFAPLFNGLIPPLYKRTEREVLGVPKTDNFTHPQTDLDEGRYKTFSIEYYKGAFKTPTVRNVAATDPYMHNGAFRTLEKVVEFYNKGGGRGLGLKVDTQTLSSEPLNLTDGEIKSIVSFLNSLTDTIDQAKSNYSYSTTTK